jgi:hypothetical protein
MFDWLTYTVAESPRQFGWYHFAAITWLLTGIVFICLFAKRSQNKQRVLLILGCVMLSMEIIKQVVGAYHSTPQGWSYSFSNLPFFPCSVGMYVIFIAGFLKKDTLLRRALYWYIVTFSLFGGACVFLYVDTIFATNLLYCLIQTVIHHSTLVFAGVYLLVSGGVKLDGAKNIHKGFLMGSVVLAGLIVAGVIINLVLHATIVPADSRINVMFVDPYSWGLDGFDFTQTMPYILWVMMFFAMWNACAYVTLWIEIGIHRLTKHITKSKDVLKI